MTKAKIIEKPTNDEIEDTIKNGKVGTILHDVRLKKKIELDDVAQNLRIKKSYLVAIEESDYANIPEAPYGAGFIRSYASFLGLNSAHIAQLFKEETKQPIEQPVTSANTSSKNINEVAKEVAADLETYIPNRKYILTSLGMLLILYIAWSISTSDSNVEEVTEETIVSEQDNNDFPVQIETYTTEEEVENTVSENADSQINITEENFVEDIKQPEKNEVVEKPVVKAVEKEEPKVQEKAPEKEIIEDKPAPAKKTGRVVLKIKKETWVEVKDEDKLWISKVLKAGDEYILPEDGVGKTVSFGNTDGVDVLIDGKAVTIVSNNKKTNIKMDPFLGNH